MEGGTTLERIATLSDGCIVAGDPRIIVGHVTHDSRNARPGSLFVAVGGFSCDGRDYAGDAVRRGAVGVVAETDPPPEFPAAWVRVDDARLALSVSAAHVAGHPTRQLRVAGVTGTNGKTTTCFMLASGLEEAGVPTALLGTIEVRCCGERSKSRLTTPEATDLHAVAAEQVDCGGGAMVFEVSSHALELKRADHVAFDVAVFTNLSQDHLDFHDGWDDYLCAKRRLFSELLPPDGTAVVNASDPHAREVTSGCRAPVLTYSLDPTVGADIVPETFESTVDGFQGKIATPWGRLDVRSGLAGDVNLLNYMAALGAGVSLGEDPVALCRGIDRLESIPGRLEKIQGSGGRRVFVDYSHTPDAVRAACAVLRPLTPGRLWVLVGCGGDRDRDKRPKMGRSAAEGADIVVVTSDNPRTEDPLSIIDMILPGIESVGFTRAAGSRGPGRGSYLVEPDRAEAIRLAVLQMEEDDCVLVAGKGHEDYQIFRDRTIHFSDQEVVRRALAEAVLEEEGPDVL